MEQTYIFLLLSILFLVAGVYLGMRLGMLRSDRKWSHMLPEIRRDATKRSRAALSGQVTEQMAPYLPGFSYRPTEARFIGKPIDFVVFQGMDDLEVEQVIFVEVKTGGGHLSKVEKSLRSAIDDGRVSWEEYRI